MKTLAKRLSWISLASVGSKVLIAFLLWRGMPIGWASVIVLALVIPFAVKLIHQGVTQNYFCDPEEQAQSLREDEIVWVSIHPNREAYIRGSRVPSQPARSNSTRGVSSAPSLTVSSASARAARLMRLTFRPHTPVLITTAPQQSDGVSR